MSIAYSNGIAPDALLPVFAPVYGPRTLRYSGPPTVGTTVVADAIGCIADDHALLENGSTYYAALGDARRGSSVPATNLFVFISPKAERAECPSTVLPTCNKCAGTVKRLISTANAEPLLLRQDPVALATADIPAMVAAAEAAADQEVADQAALRLDAIRAGWDEVRARHLAGTVVGTGRYDMAVLLHVQPDYGLGSVALRNLPSTLRPNEARLLAQMLLDRADEADTYTKMVVKP